VLLCLWENLFIIISVVVEITFFSASVIDISKVDQKFGALEMKIKGKAL
jgi:hypothetical protein